MARPGYPSYGPSSGEYPLDDPTVQFGALLNQARRRSIDLGRRGAEKLTTPMGARLAGLGAPAAFAVSSALQGNLMGGLGELGGGLVGSGLVGGIARGLEERGGTKGKLLGAGVRLMGGLIGGGIGGGLGSTVAQAATGLGAKAQEAGQRPGAGPDVEFGGVPLTETAATRKQREFDRQQQALDIQRLGGAEMALNKEILGYMMNKEIEQQKAMLPLQERMMRTQLTNAQAMLASQTAAYQQLGRQATMGKLAIGAQQERGATMRTALSQNPYMGSVIQAPNISF